MKQYGSESQLIKACLAKKSKAQFILYEKYKVEMYGICLRYARNSAQAQDFLQEGFIKVFKSLNQYRFEVAFGFWLKRVIINACISELRRKREPLQEAIGLEQIPETSEETSPPDTKGLSAGQLIEMIQQLPEGYRSVFNLYALEGYRHPEISEILGISEGTSRSQYSRARKQLATQINALKMKSYEG